MTQPTSLLEALGGRRISETDLITILEWHFGHSRIDPAVPRVVIHAHDQNGEPAITVVFNKHGGLTDVRPGSAWTQADFDAIKSEIDAEARAASTQVRRVFAFARVPTVGTWRYRDGFQICPPPADAPTPSFAIAPHPFVLEVRFPASSHRILNVDRGLVAVRRVELLLSLLLKYGVRAEHALTRHVWTLVSVQKDPLVLGSELRQEGYTARAFHAFADEFSSLSTPLPEEEFSTYFGGQGTMITDTLGIPVGLSTFLDQFYSLSSSEQQRFLRACYWFQHANEVRSLSMSSVYMALIQAIETLLPVPHTEGHCSECNRRIGPGPTHQFIDFVEAHVPGLSEGVRRRLYEVRSDLSHGSRLLLRDEYVGMGGHFRPEEWEQENDIDRVTLVARLALISWLGRQFASAE